MRHQIRLFETRKFHPNNPGLFAHVIYSVAGKPKKKLHAQISGNHASNMKPGSSYHYTTELSTVYAGHMTQPDLLIPYNK